VLQYTNRGPTPRATARVALGVYPPLVTEPFASQLSISEQSFANK
jgi:hypothetical protein